MRVGQHVLLIAQWFENECTPPPIGATGEIVEPIDAAGDYVVDFHGYPCPIFEPTWFTPHWAIVPIDDPNAVHYREREATVT